MDKQKLLRIGVRSVATLSVATVINNVVAGTTPPNMTRMSRLGVKIGTLIISSMIAEIAANDFMRTFEEAMNRLTENEETIPTIAGAAATVEKFNINLQKVMQGNEKPREI